jgi:hypothetical protein
MAQAILVKYLGPTNTKGARLKAISWLGSLTVPYDHALNPTENRERAAHALCQKMGIRAALLGARLPRKLGHAFIMSPIEEPLT